MCLGLLISKGVHAGTSTMGGDREDESVAVYTTQLV